LIPKPSLQVKRGNPCFYAGEGCNARMRRPKRCVDDASNDFSQLKRNETGTSPNLFLAKPGPFSLMNFDLSALQLLRVFRA
jgi:hypothetical protein